MSNLIINRTYLIIKRTHDVKINSEIINLIVFVEVFFSLNKRCILHMCDLALSQVPYGSRPLPGNYEPLLNSSP